MSISVIPKIEETGSSEQVYLSRLLRQCAEKKAIITADFLSQLRQQATSFLAQSSLPNKKDEEWCFTDLSDLLASNFLPANSVSIPLESLEVSLLPEATQSRLVFVNGNYSPEFSDVSALPPGVYVGNLADLPVSQSSKIVKHLGQQEGEGEVFTALNTAGLTDVAIVWANPNVIVETPIHLLFLSQVSGLPTFSQPRVLIIAETGSSLELVESYSVVGEDCTANSQTAAYFTNAVTEIWLGENAQINHNRIQRESSNGFHIAKSAIAQARDSRYTCNEINFGGRLYRHNLEIFQQGEQTQTKLNGLTLIGGKQTADTHSVVFLRKPYGTVNQHHKCIIDDQAHAIFNGKIFVPKAAQLTNAAQLNRNLLLSPKARVNTKPELQITADNVKCSHGATVSQLEDDELFYLRSRGLTDANARHLLIDAFAAEILATIPLESLRQRLTNCVACRHY